MKRERIYWDEEEKETLVQRIFELIQINPITPINTLIEQAQEKLPEVRRRPNLMSQSVPWLEDALADKFRERNNSFNSKDKKIEKLQESLERVEEQVTVAPSKDEILEEAVDTMDSTEHLVRYIQKQGDENNALLYRLERMEAFVYNVLPDILSASGKAALVKPEKRKLVFVGFNDHEIASAKFEFSKYADLTFVSPSMPLTNYPQKCGQIFMSKKGTSENLRSKLLSNKKDVCTVVNGGVVKLKKAIWEYLNS